MQRVFHGDVVQAVLVDRTDRKGRKEVKILDFAFWKEVEAGKGKVGHYLSTKDWDS